MVTKVRNAGWCNRETTVSPCLRTVSLCPCHRPVGSAETSLWKSLEDPVPSSSWLAALLGPLWKPRYGGRERGWRGVLAMPPGQCPSLGLLGQLSLCGISYRGGWGVVSPCAPYSRKESEASTGWGRHGEHPRVGQRPPSRPAAYSGAGSTSLDTYFSYRPTNTTFGIIAAHAAFKSGDLVSHPMSS